MHIRSVVPRYSLFLSLFLAGPLAAQITLTSAYFPEVGDRFLTNQATDAYRDGITFQPPGENLSWDFGTPDMRFEITEVLEAVTNDTFFVDADARLTSPAFNYEYYQRTDTSYNLVGLVGTLPFLPDTVLSTRLIPPRPVKRADITYGDQFATTSVRELRIHVDSLPAEFRTGTVGTFLALYDSLRVVNTSVRNDVIDAYGTLRLAGKDYEVLREKRVEQLETRLYLKQGDGAYEDVTAGIQLFDPAAGEYLGEQPATGTYYFWAQGVIEPIVEIEFDENEQPTTFLYIRGERSPTSLSADPSVSEVTVSPNPATAELTVNYTLEWEASVRLSLYDAAGRRVREWAARPPGSGKRQWTEGMGDLPAGTYFLELKTAAGRTIQKIIKQ